MKGTIIAWDSDRGVGTILPDIAGASTELFVSTALLLESGLGQPSVGQRYAFRLRSVRGARIEPFDFRFSNRDASAANLRIARPAAAVSPPAVAGNPSVIAECVVQVLQ